MSITIGSVAITNLLAQPFGYNESDTTAGRTAQKWAISGLVTPSEWLDLLDEYNNWRDLRILDEPTKISEVVGTTISLSGDGPSGQLWSDIECWFLSSPVGTQAGIYIQVDFELVDASQALEIILKEKETEQEEEDESLPDLGTYTIGSAVLKLLKPKETYSAGPSLQLTASGIHYISGPLVVQKIYDIEGTTDASGWDSIREWYESIIIETPFPGTWFPTGVPSASAENKIVDGVTTIQYTVSIQLGKVL
jgi:hypothetical protein